jgi:hypothetical protein
VGAGVAPTGANVKLAIRMLLGAAGARFPKRRWLMTGISTDGTGIPDVTTQSDRSVPVASVTR